MNMRRLVHGMLVVAVMCTVAMTSWAEDRIGVSIWDTSSPLAKDVIRNLNYAADTLGIKIEVVADGFKPETQVTNIENLIAEGCNGVMICNCSDAVVPKLVKLANQARVPLALYFRQIDDPTTRVYAEGSKYFVGNVHEDEVAVGYNLGKVLAKRGSRNVALINYNKGDTTAEARAKGYRKAFEEFGVKLVGEQWDIMTAEKAANAAANFIAAFPKLDGLAVGGGGGEPLAGAIRAVQNAGKIGKINITASDFGPDIATELEGKEVVAMSGGHFTDPLFTFMFLYNRVDGHTLSDKAQTITMQPLYLSSVGEAQNYQKWCVDSFPYNADEIKYMTVRYNKDFNLAELRKIAAAYSLKDVMKRHQQ